MLRARRADRLTQPRSKSRRAAQFAPERLEARSLLSLVAAYGFNEGSGTTLTDLSGKGNHGTLANASWTSSGKYGRALSFNGTSSWVTINDSPSLDLTSGMTVEAWVKPSTTSGWRSIITKERPGGLSYALYGSDGNSRPGAYVNTGGSDRNATGPSKLSTTAWTHLAMTYDGSTLRLYVNATLKTSTAVTGSIATSANPLRIGGNSVWGEYFRGSIDEVRIYDVALSQSSIQIDMNTAVTTTGDSTPPSVLDQKPGDKATGVATTEPCVATFSESIQPSSINYVLRNAAGVAIPAQVTYDDASRKVTLKANANLAASTSYTATISGVKDLAGNVMTMPASQTFTTAAADTTPPAVTARTPAPNATSVPVGSPITATFSESVLPGTISFVLVDGNNNPIASTVSYTDANRVATLTPTSSLAYSSTYTARLSGAADQAGNSLSPTSWSFSTAQAQATAGVTYYVSPSSTSGTGTSSSPYGLRDLIQSNGSKGLALMNLRPGDTLTFLAGDYHFNGTSGGDSYQTQLLSPAVSGTASRPITLQAQPGATVNLFEDSGQQPILGTSSPRLDYVRFVGLRVQAVPTRSISISGAGNEVAYCQVVGAYLASGDNHDGIRIEGADGAWVHHNEVRGVTGTSINSAGIKVYTSGNLVVEDNYIHDNTTGVYDKDSGLHNTYRRNWVTANDTQFLGSNQGSVADYLIYDNVLDGPINLVADSAAQERGTQIYNNLIRTSSSDNGKIASTIAAGAAAYQTQLWNNVTVARNAESTWAYRTYVPFTTSGSNTPLTYMDYNVYVGTPSYYFASVTKTRSDMAQSGFESRASTTTDPLTIFQDQTSYVLRTQWTTAGRYGDPVGPRFPVAQIISTARYGPAARGATTTAVARAASQTALTVDRAAASAGVGAPASSLSWQQVGAVVPAETMIDAAIAAAYQMSLVPMTKSGAVLRRGSTLSRGRVGGDPVGTS
ncbi:MAG: Ig-like domain-containing protein [Isosphaeraceae bacterium]